MEFPLQRFNYGNFLHGLDCSLPTASKSGFTGFHLPRKLDLMKSLMFFHRSVL